MDTSALSCFCYYEPYKLSTINQTLYFVYDLMNYYKQNLTITYGARVVLGWG